MKRRHLWGKGRTTRRIVAARVMGLGLLVLLGCGHGLAQTAAAGPEATYVPDRILVRFEPRMENAAQENVVASLGGRRILRRFSMVPGLCVIELNPGVTVAQARADFHAVRGVRYAEPDYVMHANAMVPNDTRFSDLWGMHNSGQTGGTPDADIDAPEAWGKQTDAGGVIVAVIDTGVDYTHPDLKDNMWVNAGEIPGNGIDDDGNGYVDDVHGFDFVDDDGDPYDEHYHGTHCAGTLGAEGNNGQGVAGVCWKVQIMALRFLDASGSGYTSAAISCIQYAAQMGARVLSNSWGGGGDSAALKDAIESAAAQGIIFVAAAGNDALDTDVSPHYPASYDSPSIVAVLSTNDDDERSWFSNTGATTVDLGAPGSSILSCEPGGGYRYLNGTSMATPHVAGACALLLARNPLASVSDLKNALMTTVDPTLPGLCASGGRMNLNAALDAILGGEELVAIATADLTSGNAPLEVRFTGEARGGAVAPPPAPIDFHAYTIQPYGGPQDDGSAVVTVEDGGATLHMTGNGWKKIAYPYTVTPETSLEFDFRGVVEGEIHGMGMDTDDTISPDQTFQVYGTQVTWGIQDYRNYGGSDWVTYQIPVGSYFTGSFDYLVFVNDHDDGAQNGESLLRHVRLYEPDSASYSYTWDFGDGSPASTEQNPVHTYTDAGIYTSCLTVSDGFTTAVDCVSITVTAATVTEVIVDDDDGSPSMAFHGDWAVSRVSPGFYGSGYRHDRNAEKGTKTATFTPELPAAGDYEVSIRYTSHPNRARNVPVDINHSAGRDTVAVDQRTGGGQWERLGTWAFAAGSGGSVVIRTEGTDGYVVADAVRFVSVSALPPEEIVDDADAFPAMVFAGDWKVSDITPGYYGEGYRHDRNESKGAKTATFTPTLPETGSYGVYIRYTSYPNRASNVPVDIHYSGGSESVVVDQRTGGGDWRLLGTWTFAAGDSHSVVIRTEGTDGYVIADAVRFVKSTTATISEPVQTVTPAVAGQRRSGSPREQAAAQRSGASAGGTGLVLSAEAPEYPVIWSSSDESASTPAELALDGDPDTAWIGADGASPWWVMIDLGKVLDLDGVEVVLGAEAGLNLGIVGSTDAAQWTPLSVSNEVSVACRYLYMTLWHDDPRRTDAPRVYEVLWWDAESATDR